MPEAEKIAKKVQKRTPIMIIGVRFYKLKKPLSCGIFRPEPRKTANCVPSYRLQKRYDGAGGIKTIF